MYAIGIPMYFERGDGTGKFRVSRQPNRADFVERLYNVSAYSIHFSDTDCGYQTLPAFGQSNTHSTYIVTIQEVTYNKAWSHVITDAPKCRQHTTDTVIVIKKTIDMGWHDRLWTISISNLSLLLTVTSNNFISPCRYIQWNCSYKIS